MKPSTPELKAVPLDWVELVRERIANLRYGEVQLVIHDGRVTQIECTEKLRLPPPSPTAP